MSEQESLKALCVDDDEKLLAALRRSHRRLFDLHTADNPIKALDMIRNEGPFAVIVSDYRMPGMDGVAFLAEVQRVSPESIRVMLTGNTELHVAMDAVNKGRIFRFLSKPCDQETFAAVLTSAMEQYALEHCERDLLEQTLKKSLEVLADILSLANPEAFGRSFRLRRRIREIAAQLGIEDGWEYETAALLSQIGLVAVPPGLVTAASRGEDLPPEAVDALARHPLVARDLLKKIPRMGTVAEIIGSQFAPGDRKDLTPEIAEGGAILQLALAVDDQAPEEMGISEALEQLGPRVDLSEDLIEALKVGPKPREHLEIRSIDLANLSAGMILGQNIKNEQGVVMVPEGREITETLLKRIEHYAEFGLVATELRVLVSVEDCEGSSPEAAMF